MHFILGFHHFASVYACVFRRRCSQPMSLSPRDYRDSLKARIGQLLLEIARRHFARAGVCVCVLCVSSFSFSIELFVKLVKYATKEERIKRIPIRYI